MDTENSYSLPLTGFVGQKHCVICDSPYMVYVRHVPTRRTKRQIPLYYCMNCESLTNPTGYREDAEQLTKDLQWNIGVIDRNIVYSETLLKDLKHELKRIGSILEIGCGIGTMLNIAAQQKIKVLGYDVNKNAVDYGIERWKLDLRSEIWNRNTVQQKYDLVACISVLEHIDEPRGLLGEIAAYCEHHHSAAFISVPFVERDRWHYILDPDPYKENTPFFDNDVHVTHFSIRGLSEVLYSMKAKHVEYLNSRWRGVLARF